MRLHIHADCLWRKERQRGLGLRAPISSGGSKQLALSEGYAQLLGGGEEGGVQESLSRGRRGECVPGGASGSPDGHGFAVARYQAETAPPPGLAAASVCSEGAPRLAESPGPLQLGWCWASGCPASLDFSKAVFFALCPFWEVWGFVFLVGPSLHVGLQVELALS